MGPGRFIAAPSLTPSTAPAVPSVVRVPPPAATASTPDAATIAQMLLFKYPVTNSTPLEFMATDAGPTFVQAAPTLPLLQATAPTRSTALPGGQLPGQAHDKGAAPPPAHATPQPHGWPAGEEEPGRQALPGGMEPGGQGTQEEEFVSPATAPYVP